MGGEEDGDDADSNSMPSFVTKIINWYVKRKFSKANKSKHKISFRGIYTSSFLSAINFIDWFF